MNLLESPDRPGRGPAHVVAAWLLLFLFAASARAQVDQDSLFIRQHYTRIERRIPMRDGVKLFTSIYLPKDSTRRCPILLQRAPYSVAPYGEDKYKTRLGPSMDLARDGYIIVYQDVPGKMMSEGDFEAVRPHDPDKRSDEDIDESSDTYDTVEWLLENLTYHNGRVGVWGISAASTPRTPSSTPTPPSGPSRRRRPSPTGSSAPTGADGYAEYVSDPDRPVPHTPQVVIYRDDRYVIQDQRFAATRPDVLVFESEPLEEDVTVAGDLFADLFVSTTGTDADFIVKLIDVYPGDARCALPEGGCTVPMGGFQQMVRGEVMRAKFRR